MRTLTSGRYINQYFGGCPNDRGWMMVTEESSYSPCSWERDPPVEILYSPLTSIANVQNEFVHADTFVVLVDIDQVSG